MYKNILVPIEPGDLTRARESLELAQNMLAADGKMHILTVIEPIPTYVVAELPADISQSVRTNAQKDLRAILDKNGLEADIKIEIGHAGNTILGFADSTGIDLIVIASHKPEMLDFLLGSTAAHVVRRAKCSVLVTR